MASGVEACSENGRIKDPEQQKRIVKEQEKAKGEEENKLTVEQNKLTEEENKLKEEENKLKEEKEKKIEEKTGPPPEKPLPGDCCGQGCDVCVWDTYWEDLDEYKKLRKAAEEESG